MIKYNVIESQRKVVAKIDNCENDAYNVISKACNGMLEFFNGESFKLPTYFTAVAKCHPDDEFDIEKGKEIARKRVIEKYNDAMSYILLDFATVFDICADNIDKVIDKYIDDDIKALLNE